MLIIIIILFLIQIFSGGFDTRGSLIALFVPEIWPTRFSVTEDQQKQEQSGDRYSPKLTFAFSPASNVAEVAKTCKQTKLTDSDAVFI